MNQNSVNTSYYTHFHSLGQFGQGSIDPRNGHLRFESQAFTDPDNCMPMNIKHLYNSAMSPNSIIQLETADFSTMKLGNGFKLNIMQSVMPTTFQHNGVLYNGYVYIGANGEHVYFKERSCNVTLETRSYSHNFFEDARGSGQLYDPKHRMLIKGDGVYLFDKTGRLIRVLDNCDNYMDIVYVNDRITTVSDAAGRKFHFVYADGYLTKIIAPDNTCVEYEYHNGMLSIIAYPDGTKAVICYTLSNSKPYLISLSDKNGHYFFKMGYVFNGDRLESRSEYTTEDGVPLMKAKYTYSYCIATNGTIIEISEQKTEDICGSIVL